MTEYSFLPVSNTGVYKKIRAFCTCSRQPNSTHYVRLDTAGSRLYVQTHTKQRVSDFGCFPQFETQFDANALLLKILHFSICKKSPMVLNTHSFKRVWLDDWLTWRDAASVRINLKVTATQRHSRERVTRARWLAISKVRFLYGLPTYLAQVTAFWTIIDCVLLQTRIQNSQSIVLWHLLHIPTNT